MKKVKIIILLFVLILITGCSGTYNIKIDKDLKVKEDLDLVLEDTAYNREQFNNLIKSNIDDEDDYSLKEEGDNLRLKYKHTYNSIEDYLLDSVIYKQLFGTITYNSDGKEISFETKNVFNLNSSTLDNSNKINLLQINLTTPLNVVESNADIDSEKTYSWTLDKNTKEKEIFVTLNLDNQSINRSSMIIIISFFISVVIIIIIATKRLLEARKI